jgi:hypothetical protein
MLKVYTALAALTHAKRLLCSTCPSIVPPIDIEMTCAGIKLSWQRPLTCSVITKTDIQCKTTNGEFKSLMPIYGSP